MDTNSLATKRVMSLVFIMTVGVIILVGSGALIEIEEVSAELTSNLSFFPYLGLAIILFSAKLSSLFKDPFQKHIVFLVLVEAGTIFGFVSSFLTADPYGVLGLGSLAILMYIIKWPK